mmetsp:Transcript_10085/g.17572  ORF Transcript_10085/g.17572 Transcript_10085/m.17572 type:complete len:566 (-) Transcript_10085:722-2419(-)|eukprot:CAMPEP_0119111078 /NCGR_PEP_ID=MMETSP1180-20130426/33711_1 /TAXON_ID=3052 ORGANISM="Chlamydomonas cf sp, Strain CCMP681" /NCGR_SAMPLE_ID=MMETSP1180 /ASSEMBLY_ACC=CAM_ASM_000741 /LENGTH=565 /DNA_ID=CAMNT_0007097843 /DNA_START=85 /DNA_END=1782 /DNA_ORIENTATION=+
MQPDVELYQQCRSQFEWFTPEHGHPAFFENAGGSQVPRCVPAAISQYMNHSYAQLGAGYAASNRATQTVALAHDWMRIFMNAPKGTGEVMLGASSSVMLATLAGLYAQVLHPGDEVVVQEAAHEANTGPWLRAAEARGATARMWRVDPVAACHATPVLAPKGGIPARLSCPLEGLEKLLSPATRLVAIIHVSNLLGEVQDIESIVRMVRDKAPGARIVVDGVAFAPHRTIDVQRMGVDWYAFSTYKVYGPHMGALYGSAEAIKELQNAGVEGPNHFFVPHSDFTYKFELGSPSHEGCAGLLALQHYYAFLSSLDTPTSNGGISSDQGPAPALEENALGKAVGALGADALELLAVLVGDVKLAAGVPESTEDPAGAEAAAAAPGAVVATGAYASGSATDGLSARGVPVAGGVKETGAEELPCVFVTRKQVEAAGRVMNRLEQAPLEQLLSYLRSKPKLLLLGSPFQQEGPNGYTRVPTISLLHKELSPKVIVQGLQDRGFACRWGHCYALRMVQMLLDAGQLPTSWAGGDREAVAKTGVVRISLVHYNTPTEVAALIKALDEVLQS